MSRPRDAGHADRRSTYTAKIPSAYASTRFERLLATILLVGAAIVPVAVSLEGAAVFRFPNELALYAFAIVAITAATAGFLVLPGRFAEARRRVGIAGVLGLAAIAWSVIAVLSSTNRTLGHQALVYIVSVAAVGVIGVYALRIVPVSIFATALFVPAIINTTVLTLQALKIWNPWEFPPGTLDRVRKNALLGNPNDVGAYLVLPTVLAATLALSHARRRSVYACVAVFFGAGVIMTETLTTIGSTVAALVVLALRERLKRGVAMSMLLLALIAAVTLSYSPLRNRVARVTTAMSVEQFDRSLNGRLSAFIAAWEMFVDDPLTGVGPGAFKFEYMPRHVSLYERYGAFFAPEYRALNFGEVHNDHLQILAESGVPGYLLFLAAAAVVASIGLKRVAADEDLRVATARRLALPLCIGLTATMVTGFPLQIAAPAYTFVIAAAACLSWETVADVA